MAPAAASPAAQLLPRPPCPPRSRSAARSPARHRPASRSVSAPSSLGDPAAQGALHSPASPQSATIGKLTSSGVTQQNHANAPAAQSIVTKSDGAWAFTKVQIAGYYLLSFSKPGYQTVKYLIDPHSAAATQPMKVNLLPGQGILTGTVRSAKGVVGGATVTISDGSDTIVTSTNSKGTAIGHWSVHGLSTPDTFLVSVSAHHLSTESSMVTLAAGGSATVNLTLKSGVSTISGRVLGVSGRGLGGAQVTATSGSTPHEATTVTTPGLAGHYSVPDLAPGKYTVTISAAGYETQSHQVTLKAGTSGVSIGASMQLASAQVGGVVKIKTSAGFANRSGAGLTLANANNTYKITSSDTGGFSFGNVVPGTYTLTAEYFGQQPAYQTVVAAVGKPVTNITLKLKPQKVVDTSTVVGFVGNAVSSGGTLCPTGVSCTIHFQLQQYVEDANHQGVWHSIKTHLKDGAAFQKRPSTHAAASGPTPYILSAAHGLAPGVYQLTVSSLGFLTGIITVQVPLDRLAAAPQVNLYPANKLVGVVASSIRGASVNTDGGYDTQASNPAKTLDAANCVWMVPIDSSAPTTCPQQAGKAVEPSQTNCTQAGLPVSKLALIADDGTYSIDNMCDGQYQVYVVINNPAYENPTQLLIDNHGAPFDVTVSHGQTATYDPTINRKGRLALTVTATTSLNANLPVATVRLVCDSAGTKVTRDITLSTVAGVAQVGYAWGFDPGTLTNCTVVDEDAGNTDYFGVLPDPTFENNQDTVVSANLSAPVTTYLFGRVTSDWDGTTHEEPGATIDVSGTIGYSGTTPITGQAVNAADTSSTDLTTNARGCFVIGPNRTPPDDSVVPNDCKPATGPAFTQDNLGKLALHGNDATVHVHGDKYVQDVTQTETLVVAGAVPSFAADPTPVSAANLKLIPDPAIPSLLSGASIVATPDSTDSPGTVTATVDGNAKLTWLDSSIGQINKAYPGTYTLSITASGFKPATASVICLPDPTTAGRPAPACTITNATVSAYGALNGTITGSGDGVAANAAVPNATVVLAHCADSSSCPTTAPTVSSSGDQCLSSGLMRTTDSHGNYSVQGTDSAFCMETGTWVAFVTAPGYSPSAPTQFTVVSGTQSAPAITLPALGRITGRLEASGAGVDNVPIAGATVSAVYCGATSTSPCNTQSTTQGTSTDPCPQTGLDVSTGGDGTFAVDEQDDGNYCLTAGYWQLSVNVAGYSPTSTKVLVGSGIAQVDTSAVGIFSVPALGQLSGQIIASSLGNQPVPNPTVTMNWCSGVSGTAPTSCGAPNTTLDGSGCNKDYIVRQADGSGRFQVQSSSGSFCMALGWYHVTIAATGFGTDAGYLEITSGINTEQASVVSQGALSGTVSASLHGATTNLPGLGSATLTLFECSAGQTSDATCDTTAQGTNLQYTATTNSSGFYQFSKNNSNYFLDTTTSGGGTAYYRLTVSAPGYDGPKTIVFAMQNGDNTQPFTLHALASVSGTLTGSVASGNSGAGSVANASITMAYCGNGSTPTTPCTVGATSAVCNQASAMLVKSDLNGHYGTTSSTTSPYCMTPGWWQISASATGYDDTYATTTLSGGTVNAVLIDSGDNSVPITLPSHADLTGTISGTATPAPGTTPSQQLGNATVSVRFCGSNNDASQCNSIPSGTPTETATTNPSGKYDFASSANAFPLAVGEYRVTVTRSGYQQNGPTSVYLDSGVTARSTLLYTLGDLTGSVGGYPHDVDTDPTTPINGATVTLTFCGSSASSTCPTNPTNVQTATTLPDGSFDFANGGDNPLALGYWQLSVSAPGYETVTPSSLVQIATGPNSLSGELDLFKLVKLSGTVSGTVGNTGSAFTQKVAGASITATYCGLDAATPVTDCPGASVADPITVTTQSDQNGNYTFAQNGNQNTLQHGWWEVTTSAFGYTDNTTDPFQLVSGTDSTVTLPITVKNVTQNIAVQITVGSHTIDTSHVTVTLTRADNCQAPSNCTPITLTSSGSTWQASNSPKEGVFVAANIVPTTYNVVISGDSSATGSTILQTFGTIVVPLSNSGTVPDASVPVTLIQNNVTGTITGDQAQTTGQGLANVWVDLGTVSGGTFTTATNAAGSATSVQTDSSGNFTIAGIPNGTYQLRINEPDSPNQPVDGYVGEVVSTPVVVQYGTVQFGSSVGTVGTIDLTRQTQNVFYALTPSQGSSDDISGFTAPVLTSADPAHPSWKYTSPSQVSASLDPDLTTAAGQVVWEWTGIPFGCWTISTTLAADHHGTLSSLTNASTGSDSNLSCTSGSQVAVRGDAANKQATVTQTLTEYRLDMSVALTEVSGNSPTPAPVTYTVTGNSLSITKSSFPTDGTITKIWLPAFASGYALKASAGSHTALWPNGTGTASFSGGTGAASQGALTMDETSTLGEIDVPTLSPVPTGAKPLSNANSLTVSVFCLPHDPSSAHVLDTEPNDCATTGLSATDKGSSTSPNKFKNLQAGSWYVELSGSLDPVNSSDPQVSVTLYQKVTVTAGDTVSTDNTKWTTTAP